MSKENKYGVIYYKNTDNIGDDIQTYAALKQLPRVDYFIDRENIDSFIPKEKGQVITLMNGWYLHKRFNFPISPYIYPILLSMHFSSNDLYLQRGYDFLEGYPREVFSKYGKVGCRDLLTMEELAQKGYDTYYSGCMTMTIPPLKKKKTKDYICAVDLKDNVFNALLEKSDIEVKKMTHWVDPAIYSLLSLEKRMERVEEILSIYQNARLVITDRLHTALPCLAIGVPVILIYYSHNGDRLSNFLKYVTNMKEEEFMTMSFSDMMKVKNPRKHLKVVDSLKAKIKDTIENASLEENLPDIVHYEDMCKRMDYIKHLFLNKIYSDNLEIDRLKYENKMLESEKVLLESEVNSFYNSSVNRYLKLLKGDNLLKGNAILKISKVVVSGNIVKCFCKYSEDLKIYFKECEYFSIEYPISMEGVPKSILVIPFVCYLSSLLSFKKVTLYISELDKDFYSFLEKMPWRDNIKAKLVENTNSATELCEKMLLFDGNPPSYEFFMAERPAIVSILNSNKDEANNTEQYLYSLGLSCSFVREHISNCVDLRSIDISNSFSSLCYIGLVLPYLYRQNVKEFFFPYRMNSDFSSQLFFGNTNVTFASSGLVTSIQNVCNYSKEQGLKVRFRVCSKHLNYDNCTVCEECAKVIMAISSLGEDPRFYGFLIISNTYDRIRYSYEHGLYDKNDDDWVAIRKSFAEHGYDNDSFFGFIFN